MRCVMLATEGEYMEMAHLTAPRASKLMAREVEILCFPKGHDVFREKMLLVNKFKQPVLCMDADMVVCGWDWRDFDLTKFNAVVDYNLWRWAPGLKELFPLIKAINGGLWFANYDLRTNEMFGHALRLMEGPLKDHPQRMNEQTPLNKALYDLAVPVHFLDTTYNYQVGPRATAYISNPHVIHLVGGASWLTGKPESDGEKLLRVEAYIKEFPV